MYGKAENIHTSMDSMWKHEWIFILRLHGISNQQFILKHIDTQGSFIQCTTCVCTMKIYIKMMMKIEEKSTKETTNFLFLTKQMKQTVRKDNIDEIQHRFMVKRQRTIIMSFVNMTVKCIISHLKMFFIPYFFRSSLTIFFVRTKKHKPSKRTRNRRKKKWKFYRKEIQMFWYYQQRLHIISISFHVFS